MNDLTAARGLIYARASRDPRRTGTSVTKQIERGRGHAARLGVTVVAEIRDDNRSASRGSRVRPGFEQARTMIDRGEVDILILWEISRGSRDLEEIMGLVNACADRGIRIAVSGTVYDPALVDEWMPLVFGGVMSEAEARRIRKRNLDSVETNARKGTPHGRLPYGYRRIYDPRSGVLIGQTPYADGLEDQKILTAEAQVIHDAAHAVLAGASLRSICLDLTARGIPTARKPRASTLAERPADVVTWWEPQTLRQILMRPTIAGRRIHRGQDVGPAAWEPIIDHGTWLRLHALLSDPTRRTVLTPRGPEAVHLLSRIARCGECGARLHAVTNSSRLPVAYACKAEDCRKKVTASAPRVDERVDAVIRHLLGRPDTRRLIADAFMAQEHGLDTARDHAAKIAEAERELAALDALRSEGGLTLRAYGVESARIEAALRALREIDAAPVASPALRRLVTAESLVEEWRTAALVDRREVVATLLDVRVRRATMRGRNFDPERVQIRPSQFLLAGAIDDVAVQAAEAG